MRRSRNALHALIKSGVVDPQQAVQLAPLRISRRALDAELVQSLAAALKADGRLPKGGCPEGQHPLFPNETTRMKQGAL
jgi:hypothetical protein